MHRKNAIIYRFRIILYGYRFERVMPEVELQYRLLYNVRTQNRTHNILLLYHNISKILTQRNTTKSVTRESE